MEFDKSRVYTALNAEDLPIGSECIFADDLNSLREKIQEAEYHVSELTAVEEDCEIYRFDNYDDAYALAYLVELPQEPKYKPFESGDKAMEAIKRHGGWLKRKNGQATLLGTGFDCDGCLLGNANYYSVRALFSDFVFADDGSPCGEVMEHKCGYTGIIQNNDNTAN